MNVAKLKRVDKVLIAADINPIGKGLVKYANKMFKNSSAEFRVVHVNQANYIPKLAVSYMGEFSGIDISGNVEGEKHDFAVAQLEEQTKDIVEVREVKTAVLCGKPSDEITRDAFSSNSELAIVAPGDTSQEFLPYGYSTSINLMAQSRVPVLAIPQSKLQGEPVENPTILICDDLTDASKGAVSYAKHFSSQFVGSKICHLHIVKGSEKEVEDFGADILEKMTQGSVPFREGFASGGFVNEVTSGIRSHMISRVGSVDSAAYQKLVSYGAVPEQLANVIKKVKPDYIVFGRHETIHARPFSIGKMPYHSMLAYDIPVIVVPKSLDAKLISNN